MKKTLLGCVAALLVCILLSASCLPKKLSFIPSIPHSHIKEQGSTLASVGNAFASASERFVDTIAFLENQYPALNKTVINKVAASLTCATEQHVEHNNILTVIDYSLPSNQKRLWVFDLANKKLLFHTYVSHGIKSGTLTSRFFSNQNNSKASSVGVYKTNQIYYGRDGLSLRLEGLDKGFNDNANQRYVVMHGGWYVDENFIKKYGRAGRSWGCPAIPIGMTKALINTIKDNAFFVIYYPHDKWLSQSKFLNCEQLALAQTKNEILTTILPPFLEEKNDRDAIFFVDINSNGKHEENEPIMVVTADDYLHLFHTSVPLTRMLRRQINQKEYIAINTDELRQLQSLNTLNAISFVIPVIKMQRGYYATEMNFVSLGQLKEIKAQTLYFNNMRIMGIKTTDQFIRWLGL